VDNFSHAVGGHTEEQNAVSVITPAASSDEPRASVLRRESRVSIESDAPFADRLSRWALRHAADESAQGVIEFALILTILCLVFLGTVDFSRFMHYQTAIQSAARQGAEMASNHCVVAGNCGINSAPTSDSVIMWASTCEAQSEINLTPSYTSCRAGTTSTWTPTCSGTCTNCTKDVCISPSTRPAGTQVTVYVGYSWKPISFLMNPFFPERSCYPGDSTSVNHHTICAKSVGLVS
jgi:Flp pilus assembly protein TadG